MDDPANHRSRTPALIVGNPSTTSLGAIRGLGRRGIPVLLVQSTAGGFALHGSRYVRGHHTVTNWDPERLHDAIRQVLHAVDAKGDIVVLATSDETLLAYAAIRDHLPGRLKDRIPPRALLETLLDKGRFYAALDAFGIAHPRVAPVTADTGYRELRDRFNTPVFLLKPVDSGSFSRVFRRKLFVIDGEGAFRSCRDRCAAAGLTMVAQERVAGSENALICFHSGGHGPRALAAFRKCRQLPSDHGTGTFIEPHPFPELTATATRVLDALALEGIGELEFMRDPYSGQWKLIEINPRSITYNRLAAAAGLDMEYRYYRDALGLSINPAEDASMGALRPWMDGFKEATYWIEPDLRRSVTVRTLLAGLARRPMHGHFALDDLRPFLSRVGAEMTGFWLSRRRKGPKP